MLRLRKSLTSAVALIVYFTINVIAGALHHHGPEDHHSGWLTACVGDTDNAQEPADDDDCDDDEDETCPICNVLHLAQNAPGVFQLEAVSILTGDAICAAPISRSYPLQSTRRSRAPPLS